MVQTFRRLDVWAEEFEKPYAVAEYILSTKGIRLLYLPSSTS